MDVRQGVLALWRNAAESGTPLPPEPEIAETLGVSRPTVREELIRMESEGLLRRYARQGTFPNPTAVDVGLRIDSAIEFSRSISLAGMTPRVEVLARGWEPLDRSAARDLELPVGSTAWVTTKRWFADETPVMTARDVVPATLRNYEPADADVSLYGTVADLRGSTVAWERVHLRAAVPNAETKRLLSLGRGSAVLELTVVGVSRHGDRLFRAEERHREGVLPYTMLRNAHD